MNGWLFRDANFANALWVVLIIVVVLGLIFGAK